MPRPGPADNSINALSAADATQPTASAKASPGSSTSPGKTTKRPYNGIASATVPRRRNRHELRLQVFLLRQFRKLVDPLDATLVSLENGEDRQASTLALLEAMGVLSGLHDLALVMTRGRLHWIEVKLEKTLEHARSELRPDQVELHELWEFYGHKSSVVRNAEEFWAIVDSYAIPHRPRPPQQLSLPPMSRKRRTARRPAALGSRASCG